MNNRREFLRQLHVMALLDRLFNVITPIFCALVILGALAVILSRGAVP